MIQDVRVIAYPVPKNDGVLLNDASERCVPYRLCRVSDGWSTGIRLRPSGSPSGKPRSFSSRRSFTARSITVRPEHRPIVANAVLEALDGSDYRPVAEFDISRFNECPMSGSMFMLRYDLFPAHVFQAFRLSVDNAGGHAPPCASGTFGSGAGRTLQRKKPG
ncbi:MAG: hypothetical protein ACLUEV_05645 [Alistipes sp.]